MLNPLIVSTTVLLGLTVVPGIAAAQQPGRQMVPVAKDVYFMTGAGSNASFVVTDDGVLVFDSDIRNNDLPFIRKVTDKKVAYLFASHASGDHSTGAWYFREDKPVSMNPITSRRLREATSAPETANTTTAKISNTYRRLERFTDSYAVSCVLGRMGADAGSMQPRIRTEQR